jgi:hypothetical protein
MVDHPIVHRAFDAFNDAASALPPMTLRGANAVDGYDRPEPYNVTIDEPTDAYIEAGAFWGLAYLDARSWRHYLPRLMDYALRHADDPAMVVEATVRSMRPPDRYPPRLSTLSSEQEAVVREFLELLAFGNHVPSVQEDARQALEEWWLPNPRSRPTADQLVAMRARAMDYKEVGEGGYRLIVPQTLAGSGLKHIPTESRRVETWGGHICGDVHTVVAVNATPIEARSFDETVRFRRAFFATNGVARDVAVRGARRASRSDGEVAGDSPVEPRYLSMVVADAGEEVVTLTVRSWPREDAIREVHRIADSFYITRA